MNDKRNLLHPQRPEPKAPEAPVTLDSNQPYVEIAGEGNFANRLCLISRKGERWFYPYAHIGLVEMLHPSLITIHCTCGKVDSIVIEGQNLSEVARLLTLHRLAVIQETSGSGFIVGEVHASEISINNT